MFYSSHRPFVTHLVFSLHFYAFLLLCLCVLLLFLFAEVWFGGAGLRSALVDKGLFAVLPLAGAIYLYLAAGTVYGDAGVVRALKVGALVIAIAAGVLGYRFLIFLITLYRT